MLKKCIPVCGFDPETERRMKLEAGLELKDITVRIVHAGGREERYYTAIIASQLTNKYPGMCVALPEVFKKPHVSILMGGDLLLPGQKYYIIPSTTVQKLKRRIPEKPETGKVNMSGKGKEKILDYSEREDGPSVYSENEYYYEPDQEQPKPLVRKGDKGKKKKKKKKAFVPPIQIQGASFKGFGWEPSLTSVQELSQ